LVDEGSLKHLLRRIGVELEMKLNLSELVSCIVLALIVIGFVSLAIEAITHSEAAHNLARGMLSPLPLWGFFIIIASMLDKLND
jgi:hypothetical protein